MEYYINKNIEWYLNVPKIFHIYWGSGVFSYLRFMTVRSFMKMNPDWEVMFWYPKYPSKIVTWESKEQEYELSCDDYLQELIKLPIKSTAVDFEDYGFKNNISEVHKSDFLRLKLLTTFGGVWSDVDIFYIRPITDMVVNTPENKDKETFVSISHYGHSTAFMLSTKGSKFFEKIIERAKVVFDEKDYQTIGTTLFNKEYFSLESINKISPAVSIGMDAIMSHDAQHISEIYDGTKSKFNTNTIGIHWYAGHQLSGKFLKETNGGLINLPDNILGNLLKNENNSNKIKNFWEEAQKIKNKSILSGCQYIETIVFLKVDKLLQPQMHVLEIGVGMGYVTKGFYENGYIISGLDISETGLKNVEKYCEKTYKLNELKNLPSNYFDIVICHNVVQHVPTDTLCEELKYILRAMKESGVLAMEFVSSDDIDDKGINPTQNEIESGSLFRTPECMKKIISNIGGECEMVVNNKCNIGMVTGCHVFHVKKK